jgi:hypothetical protein
MNKAVKSITEEDIARCKKKLALTMMVKNEEKGIEATFDSVLPYCDTFIIFDTGSIDSTVLLCREYCKKNNVRLFLKEGSFTDFMVSRNELLDFADTSLVRPNGKPEKRYLLLLDCNDKLRNADELVRHIVTFAGTQTGFHLKQQWWCNNSYDSYFNIRMVLSHNHWRYNQVVHEYIAKMKDKKSDDHDILRLDNVILFQDRTNDDDKSTRRFKRDKILLYGAHIKDQKDHRVLFYLAQTCGCLQQSTEAYQYYKLRLQEDGFLEEQYHSFVRCADNAINMNHSKYEIINLYLQAVGHSRRVDAINRLADYLGRFNHHSLQFLFLNYGQELLFPHTQILFVDRRAYSFRRWQLLATCSQLVGRYYEGKEACIRALQAEHDDVLVQFLAFYKTKTETQCTSSTQNNLIVSTYESLESDKKIEKTSAYASVDASKYVKQLEEYAKDMKLFKKEQTATIEVPPVEYGSAEWCKQLAEIQQYEKNLMPWQYVQGLYLELFDKYKRMEILLPLIRHYVKINFLEQNKPDYTLAYLFASHAVQFVQPEDATSAYDNYIYKYERWTLYAQICLENYQIQKGLNAIYQALLYQETKDAMLLIMNLYLKDKEINQMLASGKEMPFLPQTALAIESTAGVHVPTVEKDAIRQSTVRSRKEVCALV